MTVLASIPAAQPTLGELFRTFLKIGFVSFGGAAGQIAMMHTVVVDEKKWLDDARFNHALSYCMLLPGPEAQQLATYIGWLMHGVRGGLIAGLLFVIPGAAVMLALSLLYVAATGLGWVEGLFFGIKAAVLAIVIQALLKIARRSLRTRPLYALAAASLVAILVLDIAFPLVVVGAALLGAVLAAWRPGAVGLGADHGSHDARIAPGTWARTGRTTIACAVVWWAPVAAAALLLGPSHLLVDVGLFFSQLAVVTFGGAYALLVYLAQAAVDAGWVRPNEMIDGLGLAETTPGPTILVTQFVAFLAGYKDPAPFPPILAATLTALMATWVTFAPSFLWIFAGAPFVDVIRRDRRLAGALAGISAAVVGVIAYLTIWFGLHVLFGAVTERWFGPFRVFTVDPARLDGAALVLVIAACVLMFVLKRGVMTTVGAMATAGVVLRLAGL